MKKTLTKKRQKQRAICILNADEIFARYSVCQIKTLI